MPKESDFRLEEAPMPAPGDGELLIKTLYISVDPYLRSRISGVKTYIDPILPGSVMEGFAAGKVVESRLAEFQPGDHVSGFWKWEEYVVSDGRGLQKINPGLAPLSAWLGVLGMPGLTARFGFLDICQPKPGETAVVSGAAGAVGSIVGQIAKIQGCRAVGIAGADDKIAWLLNEAGFDAAFNYKTTADYSAKLKELCPGGIDCYFDNVGGAISDAVFPLMNTFGRVSVCGQISQYNVEKPEPGPRLLGWILIRQLKVEGFIVRRFADRAGEGIAELAQWLREGRLKHREEVMEGFENTPKAFIAMLSGANIGKMLVKVAEA